MSNFAIPGTTKKIVQMPDIMIWRTDTYYGVPHWEIRERLAPFWFFFWDKTPGGELVFQDHVIELSPDKIVLIPPLTLFSTHNSQPFQHMFIEFTAGGEFKNIQRKEIVFSAEKYLPLLTRNYRSSQQRSLGLYSLLFDLLLNIPDENFHEDPGQAIDPRIAKAVDLIDMLPKNQCSNLRLSQALNMSSSNFTHLFKENVGISPQRYILRRKLENAVLLLNDQQLSVSTIAIETGFADRYHFSKAFKAFFGETPVAMRKKMNRKKSVQDFPC